MLPDFESLKNSKKFLVISVIIPLCYSEGVGVKSNWINFILFINNRKNHSKNIIKGISFHNKMSIRNLVHKNRSRDKCFFKKVESIITEEVKLLVDTLLYKNVNKMIMSK